MAKRLGFTTMVTLDFQVQAQRAQSSANLSAKTTGNDVMEIVLSRCRTLRRRCAWPAE